MGRNKLFNKTMVIVLVSLHFIIIGLTHFSVGTNLYVKTKDILAGAKDSDITFDLLNFREIRVAYACICVILFLIAILLISEWIKNRNQIALVSTVFYGTTFIVHATPLLWIYVFKNITDSHIVMVMLKVSNITVSIPNFDNKVWYVVLFIYYLVLLLIIAIYIWYKPDKLIDC